MNEPLVQVGMAEGVATVTLNRPQKRNALTREFIGEIAQAVGNAANHPETRLLILAANGPAFCAGMDLNEMQARASSPDASELWREDTQAYRNLLVTLLTVPVPTLAVVNGPALAGGFGLVLACDIVLAATDASFSLPEPQRGITAAIVSPLLVYRIGYGPATYALLSGRTLTTDAALRFGICHEAVPSGELPSRLVELRAAILSGAPAALRITKIQLAALGRTELLQQLDAATTTSASARETSDAREGLAAFLEKRKPAWQPDQEERLDDQVAG